VSSLGQLVERYRDLSGNLAMHIRTHNSAVLLPGTLSMGCILMLTHSSLAGYAMEKKSSIIAIGLTIHNTPVEIREKLAIPEASLVQSKHACILLSFLALQ
jgi:hypothetical protein